VTRRAILLGATAALGLVLATTGCSAQHTYDPNGRCLGWQLSVGAEVHPTSTTAAPSWDLTFTNTSDVACVFGGVPTVRFDGPTTGSTAGVVKGAVSQEWAVQLSPGDVAYANVALQSTPPAGCTPSQVHSVRVVAPHVAGGRYTAKPPARFMGCSGDVVVAHVGQVTAKRSA
jgi:hypothetical protein